MKRHHIAILIVAFGAMNARAQSSAEIARWSPILKAANSEGK